MFMQRPKNAWSPNSWCDLSKDAQPSDLSDALIITEMYRQHVCESSVGTSAYLYETNQQKTRLMLD